MHVARNLVDDGFARPATRAAMCIRWNALMVELGCHFGVVPVQWLDHEYLNWTNVTCEKHNLCDRLL